MDLVFDCAGVQSALDQAVECLKPRGTLVNIAVWEQKAQLEVGHFLFRERKYMGVATYQEGDYMEVLTAIEGGEFVPLFYPISFALLFVLLRREGRLMLMMMMYR